MSDSYLEKALVKLARQLNAYDEASLMSLWEKYAEQVRHFEPTKRWEESVLVFNLIQSIRLKNQLFNYNWAQSRQPGEHHPEIDLAALTHPQMEQPVEEDPFAKHDDNGKRHHKGKLLTLNPKHPK